MASKGYVVRGKDADGIDVYADEDEDADVQCNPDEGTMLVGDERFSALDAAAGLRAEMIRLGCTDVAIYQVHDDGREERLPSYEEALTLLGADPLAALEAAERRLLEAGGWRPDEDDAGYWRDRKGRTCKQPVAILAERRRLAAKGGA